MGTRTIPHHTFNTDRYRVTLIERKPRLGERFWDTYISLEALEREVGKYIQATNGGLWEDHCEGMRWGRLVVVHVEAL